MLESKRTSGSSREKNFTGIYRNRVIDRRRDLFLRRVVGSCMLAVMVLVLLTACSYAESGADAGQDLVSIQVSLNGVTYTGTYEGETDENGQPNGDGTFTTAETELRSFTLDGTWTDGELDGKVKIYCSDASVIATTYENGTASGTARLTLEDGSKWVFRYSDGIATGRVRMYSAEGEFTGLDYYYDGELVSELCENAISPDYSDILSSPLDYLYEPLKISGEVIGVYESENDELLLIENSNGQLYLCRYENNGYNTPQAWMPNLTEGDRVEVYGYLSDCIVADFSSWTSGVVTSLESEGLDYGQLCDLVSQISSGGDSSYVYGQMSSTMPYLYLFYGEVRGESLDSSILDADAAVSYDYDLLCRFPYDFVNFQYTCTCTVQEILLDYDSMEATMVLQPENGQILYASYSWTSGDTLPVLGGEITVTGQLKGNAKIAVEIAGENGSGVNYIICPMLVVADLELSA